MTTRHLLPAVLVLATLAVSCDENNTIINQGLDCGLIRDNLVGDWIVDVSTGTPTLVNCTGPGASTIPPNTMITTVNDFPATYESVDVFGSDGSTSFKLLGDRAVGGDSLVDAEFTGSVQADSCLALLRFWVMTDQLYLQCIGTFDPDTLLFSGACDSAEIDTDTDGELDASCSLSADVAFDGGIN